MSEHEEDLHTMLWRLRSMEDWSRMLGVAGDLLAKEPDNDYVHENMATAYRELEKYPESEKHYKKAIALNPDEAFYYSGIAWMYMSWGRNGVADDYAIKALQLSPTDSSNWILRGHLSLAHNDPKDALQCAQKAKQLDPENTQADLLVTLARSQDGSDIKINPQEQLKEYEQLLAKDPEDSYLNYRIGAVYYDELKDYNKAEAYFRKALMQEPDAKDYQKVLIMALRKKDLVLRLLWLPFAPVSALLRLIAWSWEKKWPLIFMIFLFKYIVIIMAGFGVFFGMFFWPLTKVYEYLTISDLNKKMGRLTVNRGRFAWLHRLPFVARFGIFCVAMFAFWVGILYLLRFKAANQAMVSLFFFLVIASAITFVVTGWVIALRDGARKRRRAKQNKELSNP